MIAADATTFVEVGHWQIRKDGEGASGDAFLSQKNEADGRVISVLSDGLGSGIKAGVLSTLTATMAMKFVAADIPIMRAARTIMSTLPVCRERGISYATFTLVDVEPGSLVRVMEYDNPAYVLVRGGTAVEPLKDAAPIERRDWRGAPSREAVLQYSEYRARAGDRIVFFSDGVTQAGMGSRAYPLGWGALGAQDYVLEEISRDPSVSARDLARSVARAAVARDAYRAKDDITCAVVYFREPRELLVVSGPPTNPERDEELARDFSAFGGRKVVCGGTTAEILSRRLGAPVKVQLRDLDPVVPPMATMAGADLVTEGIITLGRVAEMLDRAADIGAASEGERVRENGATRVMDLLLDSDRIHFVVGTRVNEAHQDPNMPVELEIRRSVVRRIQRTLSERYLKEVTVRYI